MYKNLPFVLTLLPLLILSLTISGCIENTAGTDDDDNGDEDTYSHVRNPGTSANDFLSIELYTTLIVEIDYMSGYAPDNRALDSLLLFLDQRLNKAAITILNPTEIASGDQSSYTASEVRELEQEHRDHYTVGDTLTAYMLILDNTFDQGNVLGIAYYNTSSAYSGVAFEQASSGFGAPSRFLTESIVYRHEFGHLFGLVGIPNSGTNMQTDHKDDDHGNHCDNNRCLMYWAMERPELIDQFIFGEQIPTLDENCIHDLQGNDGR